MQITHIITGKASSELSHLNYSNIQEEEEEGQPAVKKGKEVEKGRTHWDTQQNISISTIHLVSLSVLKSSVHVFPQR